MRRLIAFSCDGDTLIGTLDGGDGGDGGTVGVLIVSGGNELRIGAHRGMTLLAPQLGVPVLRFDRRGIGDSTGTNRGFRESARDIAGAADALRREAGVNRILGFGNCDAASALALFGRAAGIDALVLANPWVVNSGDLPPAAAIRARYRDRIKSPAAWLRLVRNAGSIRRFLSGLRAIVTEHPQEEDILQAIAAWGDAAEVILAEHDATAIAYADAAHRAQLRDPTLIVPTAAHSFARRGDMAPVIDALRAAIRRLR